MNGINYTRGNSASLESQPFVSRILMTTDTVGGAWNYAIGLARALERYGVEIGLATMGRKLNATQRMQVRNSPQIQLFESKFKPEWMRNAWSEVSAAGDWLLGLEKIFRPDLVHLNSFAHASIGWKVPILTVAHNCVYSWHEAVHGKLPSSEWARYRREVRAGLLHSAEIVTPTVAMLQCLKKHYGITKGRVIPNGCTGATLSTFSKEALVFTCGRLWDEGKNVKLLDECAGKIEWPVYAAGDLKHPDGGEISLKNITALGALPHPETIQWMKKAAIYAMPAKYEPFGLSVLEAARSGCALILGDIPSLREVWGQAAIYVDPNNARALTEAINRLIRQPEMRIDYAARARLRAVHFQTEPMATGYLQVYNHMLRMHQPVAPDLDEEEVEEEEAPAWDRKKTGRSAAKAGV